MKSGACTAFFLGGAQNPKRGKSHANDPGFRSKAHRDSTKSEIFGRTQGATAPAPPPVRTSFDEVDCGRNKCGIPEISFFFYLPTSIPLVIFRSIYFCLLIYCLSCSVGFREWIRIVVKKLVVKLSCNINIQTSFPKCSSRIRIAGELRLERPGTPHRIQGRIQSNAPNDTHVLESLPPIESKREETVSVVPDGYRPHSDSRHGRNQGE